MTEKACDRELFLDEEGQLKPFHWQGLSSIADVEMSAMAWALHLDR